MSKVNKYIYLYVVQGKYVGRWEDLCASEGWKEARADLKAYRDNERGVLHRLIKRRELNQQSQGD